MKERLQDRFPFVDISWSRQPSFDDANLNEVFYMEGEETYSEFPATESILESHDRVRVSFFQFQIALMCSTRKPTKRDESLQ